MKKPLSKLITASLLTASIAGLVSCKKDKPNSSNPGETSSVVSSKEEYTAVYLVIDGNRQMAEVVDGSVLFPDVEKANKRFVGWNVDPDATSGIFAEEDSAPIVMLDLLIQNEGEVTLYPIYADIAHVSFKMQTQVDVDLDSIAMNIADIDIDFKDSFDFLGWATNADAEEALIAYNVAITYPVVKDYLDANAHVNLYPVYKVHSANIVLHEYFTNASMPRIDINTEGGIAIDDKSLIDPTKKKGLNKEIPVYNYVPATIGVNSNGEGYDLSNIVAEVKVRGNYTSTYKKRPIRIKFEKKQQMLGLNGGEKMKSWVLLAEWKDTSLLRNSLAYYLGNTLLESEGVYCSDFRFVKVYLNGEYNGVYVLAEQQQLNKYRINMPESELETDGVDTGYLLEFDGYYKNEPAIQTFEVDYSRIKTGNKGFTVSNDIMNQAQHDHIAKAMQTIWNVIYDAVKKEHSDLIMEPYHTMNEECEMVEDRTIATSEEAVSRVMDVKSLINMYILHEICQDRDIGWSSFYFALDLSETGDRKLRFIAPWDFDYALGNNTYANAQKGSLSNRQGMINEGRLVRSGLSYKFPETTALASSDFTFSNYKALYAKDSENPWFSVFANCEWFFRKVNQRWKDAIKAKVFVKASEMITTLTETHSADLEENFKEKWSEAMGIKIDQYQPEMVTYFSTQKQAADYLKFWFDQRIAGLTAAFSDEVAKYN